MATALKNRPRIHFVARKKKDKAAALNREGDLKGVSPFPLMLLPYVGDRVTMSAHTLGLYRMEDKPPAQAEDFFNTAVGVIRKKTECHGLAYSRFEVKNGADYVQVDVQLMYVDRTIRQRDVTVLVHGCPKKRDLVLKVGEGPVALEIEAFVFDGEEYDVTEYRLYDVFMNRIDNKPGKLSGHFHYAQTSRKQSQRPIIWLLTTRSMFVEPYKFTIGFNSNPLYSLMVGEAVCLTRSVNKSLNFQLETDAYSCTVVKLIAQVNSKKHKFLSWEKDKQGWNYYFTLAPPIPRFPVLPPESLSKVCGSSQGSVAQYTADSFMDKLYNNFVNPVDPHADRLIAMIDILATIGEEDLVRLSHSGACYYMLDVIDALLRAPWIVTRNMYFAKQGTCYIDGLHDTGNRGDWMARVGRRSFVDKDNKLKRRHHEHNGADLVDKQKKDVQEVFDKLQEDAKKGSVTMDCKLKVVSVSFDRVELVTEQYPIHIIHPENEEYEEYSNAIFKLAKLGANTGAI